MGTADLGTESRLGEPDVWYDDGGSTIDEVV